MFEIKPLRWSRTVTNGLGTDTVIGFFYIHPEPPSWSYRLYNGMENEIPCKSVSEGKRLAESFYHICLKKALKKIT